MSADLLTERQREVLELLFKGMSYREAAQALGVSISTFKTHAEGLLVRLGCGRTTEAVYEALCLGILKAPVVSAGCMPRSSKKRSVMEMVRSLKMTYENGFGGGRTFGYHMRMHDDGSVDLVIQDLPMTDLIEVGEFRVWCCNDIEQCIQAVKVAETIEPARIWRWIPDEVAGLSAIHAVEFSRVTFNDHECAEFRKATEIEVAELESWLPTWFSATKARMENIDFLNAGPEDLEWLAAFANDRAWPTTDYIHRRKTRHDILSALFRNKQPNEEAIMARLVDVVGASEIERLESQMNPLTVSAVSIDGLILCEGLLLEPHEWFEACRGG